MDFILSPFKKDSVYSLEKKQAILYSPHVKISLKEIWLRDFKKCEMFTKTTIEAM